MTTVEPSASDFRWLDFATLWRGRGKTTAVEQHLARELAARGVHHRLLEVGVGEGRITAVLAPLSVEYVALDRHAEFLGRIKWPTSSPSRASKVASNTYRLPFRASTFDGVTMVRLYDFLQHPGAVLREFHRVLRPGGWAIVSFSPRPSLATLVYDLRCFLRNERSSGQHRLTLARADTETVRPSPVPVWSSTVGAVHRCVVENGFDLVDDCASGFEDYLGIRELPLGMILGFSRAFSALPGFPHRFLLARRRETVEPPEGGRARAAPRREG
ncbi:MAG: class I SAM-dependent methyltransferase [Thermoplasmata archaeon]|nr:class I SAM-dependent methyltransferase [Thermoplasmata archaeon]